VIDPRWEPASVAGRVPVTVEVRLLDESVRLAVHQSGQITAIDLSLEAARELAAALLERAGE
jgi:redox-sensitive bicupin YhaK (pirin superfamily)